MNSIKKMLPMKKPSQISEYAKACLETLAQNGYGEQISLCGAFALSYYFEHRPTNDIERSLLAPWPESLNVDSLYDLIASKMLALIERGAPRDFYDIYTLCKNGSTEISQCWKLWKNRQELANGDTNLKRAKTAILTHLARIVQHRPLHTIQGLDDRQKAEDLRRWFEEEFLNALGY